VRLGILNLLASILTMIALYSINLRIMGKPNLSLLNQPTVLAPFETWLGALPKLIVMPLALLVGVGIAKVIVDAFLTSQLGLAMRATGMNADMAQAQGIETDQLILLGMAISNGLAALSGALFAQLYGFADVTLGVGTVVVGLATVILGEALLPSGSVFLATLAVVAGSVIYRVAIAIALNAGFLGFQAQDLNLVTAILVVLALTLPNAQIVRRPSRKKQP
ncbi:MAG: ABC transporter permease, partial [Cyanobacteria bacterium J06627_32]